MVLAMGPGITAGGDRVGANPNRLVVDPRDDPANRAEGAAENREAVAVAAAVVGVAVVAAVAVAVAVVAGVVREALLEDRVEADAGREVTGHEAAQPTRRLG